MLSILRLFVYPHECCGRVEELADDVGGGSDAEDDGAQNLFPPRQQQDRVFPSHLWPLSIFLQKNTHCRLITPVTVTRTVRKVVSIIYIGKQRRRWWVQIVSQTTCSQSNQVLKWTEGLLFLPYGYCSIDRAPLLYSSWENLSLFRHLSNSSEPTRTGVRDGESRRKWTSVIDNITLFFVCMRCYKLTDKGFPFDRRWWHPVTVTAPPIQSFRLRWKLLGDSHRGLEVQLTLKHSFNERKITF